MQPTLRERLDERRRRDATAEPWRFSLLDLFRLTTDIAMLCAVLRWVRLDTPAGANGVTAVIAYTFLMIVFGGLTPIPRSIFGMHLWFPSAKARVLVCPI